MECLRKAPQGRSAEEGCKAEEEWKVTGIGGGGTSLGAVELPDV